MTITTEVAVADGDEVQVVFAGATNSGVVGPHQLRVSTSTDAGAITHYSLAAPTGAVSSVSLALTNPASRAAGVDYMIEFRASATGALVAGAGTITVTTAPGTELPNCALVTDLASHGSTESCAGGSSPGAMVLTTQVAVAGGDEVQVVFDGVTNGSTAGANELRGLDALPTPVVALRTGWWPAELWKVGSSTTSTMSSRAAWSKRARARAAPAIQPRSLKPANTACSCRSAPMR